METFKVVLIFRSFRWEELVSLTDERKRLLKGAEQVHKFVRDASETNDHMNEKVLHVCTCTCTCAFVGTCVCVANIIVCSTVISKKNA